MYCSGPLVSKGDIFIFIFFSSYFLFLCYCALSHSLELNPGGVIFILLKGIFDSWVQNTLFEAQSK